MGDFLKRFGTSLTTDDDTHGPQREVLQLQGSVSVDNVVAVVLIQQRRPLHTYYCYYCLPVAAAVQRHHKKKKKKSRRIRPPPVFFFRNCFLSVRTKTTAASFLFLCV